MGCKIARTGMLGQKQKRSAPKLQHSQQSAECPASGQSSFPIPTQNQDTPSQFWAKLVMVDTTIKASASTKFVKPAVLDSQNTTALHGASSSVAHPNLEKPDHQTASPLPVPCEKAPEVPLYYSVVNDEEPLQEFMSIIDMVDDNNIDMFADTEGENGLGKDFNINCIKLKMVSQNRSWLLDPMALGSKLFDTPAKTGKKRTFQQILEDDKILIAFFDVRAESNALHGNFGAHLGGVIDLQVMEMATRGRCPTYRDGLNKCIRALPEKYLSPAAKNAFLRRKDIGHAICSGPDGYGAFNQRPLPRALEEYAINDVENMPELFKYFSEEPGVYRNGEKMQLILDVSKEMVDLSISPEFDSQDPDNTHGPMSLTKLWSHDPYDDEWYGLY